MHPALRLYGWLALAVCLFLFTLAGIARAHEFYDATCCNERDCSPYQHEVKTTPRGYELHDGYIVPYSEAKVSPDGKYHRCIWQGKHLCFYAPPPSF